MISDFISRTDFSKPTAKALATILCPMFSSFILLIEAIYFYNFTTPEFNVNVCLMPFWSLTALYLWKGFKDNKIIDWFLVGLFAGFGFLSKYLFIYLGVGIDIFLIFKPFGLCHLSSCLDRFRVSFKLFKLGNEMNWQIVLFCAIYNHFCQGHKFQFKYKLTGATQRPRILEYLKGDYQ